MTVTQTVRIPASRKLIIDVPPEIPEGVATLTFASVEAEPQNRASVGEDPIFQLYGRHKGIPGASVDDFLARCREDKEYELALEERQFQERQERRRNAKLST
ncbi:MAG: hypothetical protein LBC59_00095 [Chitinispirillales bacterium]|jgi:hypothetical protein|nr:hypothetical protein [Chitinispirillales bacterium]